MHDDDLRAYVEEIGHQYALVSLAVDQFNTAMRELPDSKVAVFASAQAILTGAAQVSKLLWADTLRSWTPERTAFATNRAAALRAVVQVREDSILKFRAVRNSIEHYDARLDDIKIRRGPKQEGGAPEAWDPDDKPQAFMAFVDISISDRTEALPLPIPPENVTWMRHVDSSTGEYTALDQSISIQAVVNDVRAVAERAAEWLTARPILPYTAGELGDLSDIGL